MILSVEIGGIDGYAKTLDKPAKNSKLLRRGFLLWNYHK